MNERDYYKRSLGKLAEAREAIREQRREEERQRETLRYVEERRRALRADRRDGDQMLLEPGDYGFKGDDYR